MGVKLEVEYKLIPYLNKHSRYRYVVTRTYSGYFNYHYCKSEDIAKYKDDLAKLYQVSRNNN